jgi:hypothetical protein
MSRITVLSRLFASLCALGFFAVTLSAWQPAQSVSDLAVTSLISDFDSGIAPALQIQSDKAGTYTNSKTLTSVIQGIGAWVLDSYNPAKATRSMSLGFSQPIAGSGPNGGNPVAVPSGNYKARMISKCNAYGSSMQSMAGGAAIVCPLHIRFDYGGDSYGVVMNPYTTAADQNYPETNYVNITCIFPTSATASCSQWNIWPSGTYTTSGGAAAYRNVGKLIKYVTSRGQTSEVNQGDFYFSFLILVTNP